MLEKSVSESLKSGIVKHGDNVVITAGVPVGVSGTTNLIKVHTIGKVLLKGMGIGRKSVSGKICIGSSKEELENKFEEGDILVSVFTDKDMVEYMKKASAIIVEQGGLTSHAAIVGLNFRKPTVVGAEGATKLLQNGETVTIDTSAGLIYKGEARVL